MKISHSDKRGVGRPSLRTVTARFAPNHAAITFSAALANSLNLSDGMHLSIVERSNDLYLSVAVPDGYNIKAGKADCKNGKCAVSFRCSCRPLVQQIFNTWNITKVAKIAVSSKCIEICGFQYYKLVGVLDSF